MGPVIAKGTTRLARERQLETPVVPHTTICVRVCRLESLVASKTTNLQISVAKKADQATHPPLGKMIYLVRIVAASNKTVSAVIKQESTA